MKGWIIGLRVLKLHVLTNNHKDDAAYTDVSIEASSSLIFSRDCMPLGIWES